MHSIRSLYLLLGSNHINITIVFLDNVEGSKSRVSEKDFQSLTVERLRALLKEKGLSLKGKKASVRNTLSHSLQLLMLWSNM